MPDCTRAGTGRRAIRARRAGTSSVSSLGSWLSERQNELASQDVTRRFVDVTARNEILHQAFVRVVSDVFVGIPARFEEAIRLFDPAPLPSIVIRRAEYKPSARRQHS